MYIASPLNKLCAPAERNVLCRFNLHAAPDGAGSFRDRGYKHIAPTEQRASVAKREAIASLRVCAAIVDATSSANAIALTAAAQRRRVFIIVSFLDSEGFLRRSSLFALEELKQFRIDQIFVRSTQAMWCTWNNFQSCAFDNLRRESR